LKSETLVVLNYGIGPRIAPNPKTGETFKLKATVNAHFKPGKEMRDRVNASRSQI
jgi:integration host factor subunit beta